MYIPWGKAALYLILDTEVLWFLSPFLIRGEDKSANALGKELAVCWNTALIPQSPFFCSTSFRPKIGNALTRGDALFILVMASISELEMLNIYILFDLVSFFNLICLFMCLFIAWFVF